MINIGGRIKYKIAALINSSGATDIGTLDPPIGYYAIESIDIICPGLVDISAATVALYTGAGGGGSALTSVTTLTNLNGSAAYRLQPITPSAPTGVQTSSRLYLRQVAAAVPASTAITAIITLRDLT